MNHPIEGVLVALVAVLALVVVFTLGAWFYSGKILHHCQNFGKFTAQGTVYECKEVGVAK